VSKITINYETTWHDCDLCGPYDNISVTVSKDGEIIYEAYKDGHFGDGEDVERVSFMLPAILEKLGYEVEFNEVTTDEQ
jgi:hypothetical protein